MRICQAVIPLPGNACTYCMKVEGHSGKHSSGHLNQVEECFLLMGPVTAEEKFQIMDIARGLTMPVGELVKTAFDLGLSTLHEYLEKIVEGVGDGDTNAAVPEVRSGD